MVVLATIIGLTIDVGRGSSSSRLLESHELSMGKWEMTINLAVLVNKSMHRAIRRGRANYYPGCYGARIRTKEIR
jgi:hypothetical protein